MRNRLASAECPLDRCKLSYLLDQAGVSTEGKAVFFESFDGVYTESLTMDQATLPDVIVAYQMLGAPVTRPHGGPVRLYIPEMYGYKSIKWLSKISVTAVEGSGYWEQYGYDLNAWIGKSNGRNDTPVNLVGRAAAPSCSASTGSSVPLIG